MFIYMYIYINSFYNAESFLLLGMCVCILCVVYVYVYS